MFLRMSVCHSVHRGVSMWPLPNMHFNMGPNPLPLPTAPPPGHQTWYLPAHPIGHHTWGILSALLLTSDGHHLRPVQTCSLEALFDTLHWYWHLVVTNKTRTVGKWMARIVLECILVLVRFVWSGLISLYFTTFHVILINQSFFPLNVARGYLISYVNFLYFYIFGGKYQLYLN